MRTLSRTSIAAALALALPLMARPVGAQECVAELTPPELPPGQGAVEVTVELSQPMGAVTGLEAPRESGIAVASPGEVPRTEMAAEEAPEPIAMGESERMWTIWLNTAKTKPGVYRLVFAGEQGQCTGEVIVKGEA